MELCGLKVQIGLRKDGTHDHPDFNRLICVQDSGLDWSKYIDSPQYGDGVGWHYDNLYGHKDHAEDSPLGTWIGMLVINEVFCRQAVGMFPSQCSFMTEVDCERFHETRYMANVPDARRDTDVLNGRLAEIALLEKLILHEKLPNKKIEHETRLQNCLEEAKLILDPNTRLPGVRKTEGKTWAEHKEKKQITFKDLTK